MQDQPWKGATNDIKAVALLLEYNESACQIMTTEQAELALIGSLETLRALLAERTARPQKFVISVKLILLVLRHRKANPNFLSPPAKGDCGAELYERTLSILNDANNQAQNPLRRASPIAKEAILAAIQFLQKTGGNPDIIRAISQSEDDDDDG